MRISSFQDRQARWHAFAPLLGLSALLTMAGTATAQDALGAGDALGKGDRLDGNSRVGAGGSNGRPQYKQPTNSDFRDRNYIVTDSVAGGRGFRGDVGYMASGDFTGRLGSDDSKSFRSGSALSDLIYISSPQRLDAFNIAQGTGVFEFRRDFSTLPEINNVYQAKSIDDAKIRLDRSNVAMFTGSLYSTAVAPNDVGIMRDQDGDFRVLSSPLEGISIRRMQNRILEGVSLYDRAAINESVTLDRSSMLDYRPEMFNSIFDGSMDSGNIDADELEIPKERIQSQVTGAGVEGSSYDRIVERVLENYADRKDIRYDPSTRRNMAGEVSRDLGRLEAMISGVSIGEPARYNERVLRNTDDRYDGLPGSRPRETFEMEEPEEKEEAENTMLPIEMEPEEVIPESLPEEKSGLSVSEMAEILKHRTEITQLSNLDKTRLSRTIKEAEKALSEGRFFKAERKFEQALAINPGNPLIEIARGNAQIGAGLYLSASLTLRRAFIEHPEVIDARFRAGLLPNRTRLEFAIVAIEQRIEKGRDLEGYGLVLAYIGHQLRDQELVKKGLSHVKGDARWDSLGDLLRGIWGPGDEPEPTEDAPVAEDAPEDVPADK